jgi:hypothetical protein
LTLLRRFPAARNCHLVWDLALVGQASDFGQACCRQLLHRGIRPVGPHDRRRGPGIEADSAESLAGRAQRLPREDQVIDLVNWRAGRQSLSGEPTPADRRVVSVRDEISLGNPPDENRGHAESQRHGAGQRPGSLIASGDRVAPRNGPGKLPGDEGEVGRAPQDALEVGEAPRPARPSRSRISKSPQTQRSTTSAIAVGFTTLSCNDTRYATTVRLGDQPAESTSGAGGPSSTMSRISENDR